MRLTLEQIREHYVDQNSDVASVLGVGALAMLLLGLANVTGNGIIFIVAVINAVFVWVPLAELAQKRRHELRWRMAGLDDALLEEVRQLAPIDRSLDEYVDTVLAVYTTLMELSARHAWFRESTEVGANLALVRESMSAFFSRVLRAEELRLVYDATARSVRRADGLTNLRTRVAREYETLEHFAEAFEQALLGFSEAVAASMGDGRRLSATTQLDEFAASMRRLTASLDEVEAQRAELDAGLADDGAEWERMVGADADDLASTVSLQPHDRGPAA